ncbi:LexA family protein [Hymenobacter profundi]|uniref:UmuDC operon-like protein n=1 Tax=Hymenobacter profundi TaxID=1982110 RepID=A0ABS6WUN8_9BACT|nr:S24 family peptidase [Hymenobacter profundi]MBW3127287.1 umuDC operon-like protein [Hymenobacter profundi]
MPAMYTVDILHVIQEPAWLMYCETPVPAGVPIPPESYRGPSIDLNKLLLPHPHSTYLARVNGDSMDGPPSYIRDGAFMTIDCSLKPEPGHLVVAALDGEFTVKRLEKRGSTFWLIPDNPNHQPIDLSLQGKNFEVWGVVTHVITDMVGRPRRL